MKDPVNVSREEVYQDGHENGYEECEAKYRPVLKRLVEASQGYLDRFEIHGFKSTKPIDDAITEARELLEKK